jgi:hypothetical protein
MLEVGGAAFGLEGRGKDLLPRAKRSSTLKRGAAHTVSSVDEAILKPLT